MQVGFIANLKSERSHVIVEQVKTLDTSHLSCHRLPQHSMCMPALCLEHSLCSSICTDACIGFHASGPDIAGLHGASRWMLSGQ